MFDFAELKMNIARCFLSNSRISKDKELTPQSHREFLDFGGKEFSVFVNKNVIICAARFEDFIILAGKITECMPDDLDTIYVRYFSSHKLLKPLSVVGVCYQLVLGV